MVSFALAALRGISSYLRLADKIDKGVTSKTFVPNVDIELVQGKNAPEVIRKIHLQLAMAVEPHQEAGDLIVDNIQDRMRRQVTADNRPWPALSPETQMRKLGRTIRRARTSRGVLRNLTRFAETLSTAPALASIREQVHHQLIGTGGNFLSNHPPTTVTRISPELFTDSRDVKARVHQGYGLGEHIMTGVNRKTKTPSRPYMEMSRSDRIEVDKIFDRWARELMIIETAKAR